MNLLCGVLGIVLSFQGELYWSAVCIGVAAVLDFFDGFVARMLNVSSELGKQLDSLADGVTFGVLPGLILFHLLSISTGDYYTPILQRDWSDLMFHLSAFAVPVFAVLRLAIFNLDENQKEGFRGLPTPAVGIFVASFPVILDYLDINIYHPITGKLLGATANIQFLGPLDFYTIGTLQDKHFLTIVSLSLSALMVLPISLLAFKFKSFGWKENKWKYIFIIVVLLLIGFTALPYVSTMGRYLPFIDFMVIPLLIIVYIVYSLIHSIFNKSHEVQS